MAEPLLLIGGIDSSCGAGLLRDHATAIAMGLCARAAVTAVTAQTDLGVSAVEPVAPETVAAQIAAAFAAGPIGAVKIGMLVSAPVVEAVAEALAAHPRLPVVLDPVLCATSGAELIDRAGRAAMIERLLPRVTVLTPNLSEVAALAARPQPEMAGAAAPLAAALMARGAGAVLVKDGHGASGLAEDWLYRMAGPPVRFAAQRLATGRRGTGCTFATALAAGLALGDGLPSACARAKARVTAYIGAAPTV